MKIEPFPLFKILAMKDEIAAFYKGTSCTKKRTLNYLDTLEGKELERFKKLYDYLYT